MTRTDHIAIAEALRAALTLARSHTQPQHSDGEKAIKTAAEFIAATLAARSLAGRFNREWFLRMCDIGNT